MPDVFRLSRMIPCAALVVLAASAGAPAQSPESDYCAEPVRSEETLTARLSAEINGHGDLLVLLDTDGSGGPEIVLHGAPQAGSELDAVIGALEGRSAPTAVQLLSGTSAQSAGFEIATDPGKRPVRALVGTPDCFPDESGTDLWLAGLARYTLSNFQPLAYLTIERLRASALIQRRD